MLISLLALESGKGKMERKRKKGRVKFFYLLINLGCKLWKIHIYYTLTICLQQHSSQNLSHRQKPLFQIRTKSKRLETQRMGFISSGSRYKWTKSKQVKVEWIRVSMQLGAKPAHRLWISSLGFQWRFWHNWEAIEPICEMLSCWHRERESLLRQIDKLAGSLPGEWKELLMRPK